MTRKDYIKMADTFNDLNKYAVNDMTEQIMIDKTINAFCLMLKRDNNKFDIDKFKNACYRK